MESCTKVIILILPLAFWYLSLSFYPNRAAPLRAVLTPPELVFNYCPCFSCLCIFPLHLSMIGILFILSNPQMILGAGPIILLSGSFLPEKWRNHRFHLLMEVRGLRKEKQGLCTVFCPKDCLDPTAAPSKGSLPVLVSLLGLLGPSLIKCFHLLPLLFLSCMDCSGTKLLLLVDTCHLLGVPGSSTFSEEPSMIVPRKLTSLAL